MIDIKTVEYDVELIAADGAHYLLNGALIRLMWEEQPKELAQRASITAANFKAGSSYLMSLAKINCPILIYGRWGGGNRVLVFEGTVWEWHYTSSSEKELSIVAYDKLIRLQQSKDFKYCPAGMSTKDLIGSICGDWGIPFEYKWDKAVTHEKKVFNAERISDMIIGLLEEVRQKTGAKYAARFFGGKLLITGYGTNADIYCLNGENTISASNKITVNNLVTKVKIIGKQDNDGRASVEAVAEGDLSFGVLQEIVRRDGDKTLDAAKAEADTVLKERGKPEEVIQITAPDLPFLRKGDKINVSAGNLIGDFYVEGASHNGTKKEMTLTLSRTL